MSTRYILVEVPESKHCSAMGILRRAIHRAAQDHHIKCRDVPVTNRYPLQWSRTRAIFMDIWEAVTRRSVDFSQVESRGRFLQH